MSAYIYHEPCPVCRDVGGDWKGNNLARYDDGHGYCFSCGHYEHSAKEDNNITTISHSRGGQPLINGEAVNLQKRGITAKTCAFFNYAVGEYNKEPVQIAQYYDNNGALIAQHLRYADKRFCWLGDYKKSLLFGQQLWRGVGGKRLIITEGELDAMTISQLQDNKFPVVSIRSGANSATKDIKEQLEWIESFDTVVFAFDMDEPGRKAANDCALLLTPNKARVAWLPAKDANECYNLGLVKELLSALWEAKPYRPDGIVAGTDIKKECSAIPKAGLPIPYPALNDKILGIRPGELLLFTAGSGIGKSTFVSELVYHLYQVHNISVGLICLEESVSKTARRFIGMYMDKNLSLPDTVYTDAEFDSAYSATVGRGEWYAYNHFGSSDISSLLSKMRYMAVSLGVRVILLDHISMIVSGLDEAAESERKVIDIFMTKLRSLIEETGVTVLAVTHLKRPEKGKSWNEGRQVSLTDLRGSGGLEQLSDIVVALERDQQSSKDTADVSYIRILKNRYTGSCGAAGAVRYDKLHGRLLHYDDTADTADAADYGLDVGNPEGEDDEQDF